MSTKMIVIAAALAAANAYAAEPAAKPDQQVCAAPYLVTETRHATGQDRVQQLMLIAADGTDEQVTNYVREGGERFQPGQTMLILEVEGRALYVSDKRLRDQFAELPTTPFCATRTGDKVELKAHYRISMPGVKPGERAMDIH